MKLNFFSFHFHLKKWKFSKKINSWVANWCRAVCLIVFKNESFFSLHNHHHYRKRTILKKCNHTCVWWTTPSKKSIIMMMNIDCFAWFDFFQKLNSMERISFVLAKANTLLLFSDHVYFLKKIQLENRTNWHSGEKQTNWTNAKSKCQNVLNNLSNNMKCLENFFIKIFKI